MRKLQRLEKRKGIMNNILFIFALFFGVSYIDICFCMNTTQTVGNNIDISALYLYENSNGIQQNIEDKFLKEYTVTEETSPKELNEHQCLKFTLKKEHKVESRKEKETQEEVKTFIESIIFRIHAPTIGTYNTDTQGLAKTYIEQIVTIRKLIHKIAQNKVGLHLIKCINGKIKEGTKYKEMFFDIGCYETNKENIILSDTALVMVKNIQKYETDYDKFELWKKSDTQSLNENVLYKLVFDKEDDEQYVIRFKEENNFIEDPFNAKHKYIVNSINDVNNQKIKYIDEKGVQQILKKVPKYEPIEIHSITYDDFGVIKNYICLPFIEIEHNKCKKREKKFISLAKKSGQFVLEELYSPYMMGLVHELIHFLHALYDDKADGSFENAGTNIASYGLINELFWNPEDLYTITGIKLAKNGKFLIYNPISELSFRAAEKLPIRLFYPIGGGNTLEIYNKSVHSICELMDNHKIKTLLDFIFGKIRDHNMIFAEKITEEVSYVEENNVLLYSNK